MPSARGSTAADLAGAPPHVLGDYPEWLDPYLAARVRRRAGGGGRGAGLARAARSARQHAQGRPRRGGAVARRSRARADALVAARACASSFAADAKSPAVHAEPAYLKGLIEIQDEGSQLAALLAGAKPGEQVLDLCAGGGGKTLALAAAMENKGQLYATDDDKRRLAPIHDRLERSGARNVQVRTPKSVGNELADLDGQIDLVLIDAPCTGIGAWRRNPDAKWRVRPGALEVRRQGAGRDARSRRRRWSSRAAASPMSPARCWTRRTARRSASFLGRHPDFSVEKPAEVGERAGRARLSVQPGGAGLGRRPADDAAPDRHRRVFRQPSAALCMTSPAQARQTQAVALEPAYGTRTTRFSSSISAPR